MQYKYLRPYIFLLLFATITTVLLTIGTPPAHAANPISGTIYRDFNNSGTRENTLAYAEPTVNGVEVRAYDASGTLLECNLSGPTDCTGAPDVDADGVYSLALPTINNGDSIRLEFTNLPDNLQPGLHTGSGASGSGTTVRNLTGTGAAITGIDLPLSSIGDYCGAGTPNPTLITSCYTFGDQTNASQSTLISFPYNVSGDISGIYTPLLNETETGSVYGVTYHPLTNQIFFANFIKRHSGSVPNGGVGGTNLDTLYMYDPRLDTVITFDLGTITGTTFGSDGRTAGWNFIEEDDAANNNVNNWDIVGKNGIVTWKFHLMVQLYMLLISRNAGLKY